MSDQETVERLRAQGVEVETLGNIMGDAGHGAQPPRPQRFMPARLEGCPALPEPGIYFGMSDEEYHALPALSNNGIKKLAASPMIFWARTPWLNARLKKKIEERANDDEKAHHKFGKAYHCRIMEGARVFAERYAVMLDPADFPDALVSTDQIKAAIGQHKRMQPVKPQGGKADLLIQLRRLAGCEVTDADGKEFIDGSKVTVDALKERIGRFEEEAPVQPVRKVPDQLPDGTEYMRDAVKADWIAQLLELDPTAVIFANLEAEHEKANEGKVFITADQYQELEIAALMVERDPELQHAFKGGYPEVVLIWYCPTTGVPMKAKVDFLKIKAMVDLKSIGNQRERSMEQAIRFEIAAYKYNIQPCVYFEGAREVRALVREYGTEAIFVPEGCSNAECIEYQEWAQKWAKHSLPDEWLWVFQQKGEAPITRGVWFPRGTTMMVTQDIIAAAKRTFLKFSEAFGTDPWLDVKPSYLIADEEIPQSATEI